MNTVKRTWAEISLDNAKHNISVIREYTGAEIIAVVKADAYGHGVVEIAKAFEQAGVSFFAVACLQEAIQLRSAGITDEILILGATPKTGLEQAAEYNLTQTVFSPDYARLVSEVMQDCGKEIKVHFKVDTGMGRLGYHTKRDDLLTTASDIKEACKYPGIKPSGIYMHFCDAENPDKVYTKEQFDLFLRIIDILEKEDIAFDVIHCANSAAVINFKDAHLNYVRPGLILYGLYPDGKKISELELRPVMSFKSSIYEIRTVRAGESVSYGRTFTAQKDIITAIVPAGYADGVPRGLSGHAKFLVNGKRAPVIGRVCMDMCVIDITDIPQTKIGDTVTMFGVENGAWVSIDEWAEILNTINYEVCCSITKRVPREYV